MVQSCCVLFFHHQSGAKLIQPAYVQGAGVHTIQCEPHQRATWSSYMCPERALSVWRMIQCGHYGHAA
eukprot:1144255-Pelagomonas_calceolata.AAC.9